MKNETNDEKCLACQHEEFWEKTGEWESDLTRNQWALFGCVCDPEDAESAEAYLRLIAD